MKDERKEEGAIEQSTNKRKDETTMMMIKYKYDYDGAIISYQREQGQCNNNNATISRRDINVRITTEVCRVTMNLG